MGNNIENVLDKLEKMQEGLLSDFKNRFKKAGVDEKKAMKIISKYRGGDKAVPELKKVFPKITAQMIDDLIGRWATS